MLSFIYRNQPKLWLSIVPLGLAIVLIPFSLNLMTYNATGLIIWLVALLLYSAGQSLAGLLSNGLWTGYLSAALVVTWMSLGLFEALWVLILGTLLGCRLRLASSKQSFSALLYELLGRIVIGGIGVLLGWGLWRMAGNQTPVVNLDEPVRFVQAFFAVMANWASMHLLGTWLTGVSPRHRLQQIRTGVFLDFLLQLVALGTSSIVYRAGVVPYLLMMGLILSQAFRHRQLLSARQSLLRRFNEMATLNERSQEVMFSVSRDESLKAACGIARDISQAHSVAIFINSTGDNLLRLAASVNIPPQVHLDDFPTQRHGTHTQVRIIEDVRHGADETLRQHADVLATRWYAEVPLRSGGINNGMISLYHPEPLVLVPQQIKLLEMLSAQVVAALDNNALLNTLEMFASEQAQLVHLSRISGSSLDLERVLEDVSKVLCQMSSASGLLIALQDEQERYSIYLMNPTETHIRHLNLSDLHEQPELARVFAQNNTNILQHFRHELTMPHLLDDWIPTIESIVSAPLVVNQSIIGVALVLYSFPYTLNDNDVRLLEMAMYQVAAQVLNASNYARTQREANRRLHQLTLIEDIAKQIAQTLDVHRVIESVLSSALQATEADFAGLGVIDGEGMLVISREGRIEASRLETVHVHRLLGIMGEVMRTGESILTPDNSQHPAYLPVGTRTYRSSLVVPLKVGSQVIGALNVESVQPAHFTPEYASFLRSLAGHAAVTMDNVKLLEALQNSSERLSAILNATRDGIILLGDAGTIQMANLASQQLLGFPILDYLSRPLEQAVRACVQEQDERYQLIQHSQNPSDEQVQILSFIDGDLERSLSAVFLPVRRNELDDLGRLLVLRDVTQEKRLEADRRLLQRAIVHDLLNPLQVIIYSFGILESDERIPMDETNVYAFSRGMDAIQRLKNLANTILDVEKGISLNLVQTRVSAILKEAVNLTSIGVEDVNNRVETALMADYVLECDADLLTRVFVNLINNANKFIPKDQQGIIRITCLDEGEGWVRMRVSDTGPGIPEDMREEIFKEFRQIEGRLPISGKGGWGIGLTFCKMAVEAHQGRIWVEPNGTDLSGACFAFRLPVLHREALNS